MALSHAAATRSIHRHRVRVVRAGRSGVCAVVSAGRRRPAGSEGCRCANDPEAAHPPRRCRLVATVCVAIALWGTRADRTQPASTAGGFTMIRPLRRRHRWMIPALLALSLIGAALALVRPWPSARMEALPRAVV